MPTDKPQNDRLESQRYPEWRGESLDGIKVHRAEKLGPNAIRIVGLGILISDQTGPVCVELR